MSHEFESGFSVREPMWHGLGVVLDEYPGSPEEACTLAGLDWTVEKRPALMMQDQTDAQQQEWAKQIVRAVDRNRTPATKQRFGFGASGGGGIDYSSAQEAVRKLVTPEMLGVIEVPNRWATFRTDTQMPLGFVTDDYEVIQNIELFHFVHDLIKQDDEPVLFETAGSLKGGRVTWALCSLPNRELVIPGTDDRSKTYISAFTGHDGGTPFMVTVGKVRIVCMNTFRMNLNSCISEWTVKHVGNVMDRVEEARTSLGLALKWNAEYDELAKHLATIPMTGEDFTAFTDLMFPMPTVAVSDRVLQNVHDRRATFEQLYSGQGNPGSTGDFAAIGNTRWAGLNAATEYFDYHMRVMDTIGEGPMARRFTRSMIDNDKTFKGIALNCLMAESIPEYVAEKVALN